MSSRIPPGSLQEALAGIAPFDVTGNLISVAMRDASIARLNRYRKAWDFYYGNHWANPYEDGEEKPVMNFCKKIVDTSVDWFVAMGCSTTAPNGNEPIAELVDLCWDYNDRLTIMERAGQYGSITGDAFFYVTLETKAQDGTDLPPEEQRVRIMALDPSYCFPLWNPYRQGVMMSILIQIPITVDGQDTNSLFSVFITPTEWSSWIDEEPVQKQPNPFGRINVVHVPNLLLANSVYGQSDIHTVIPLNEEYNLVLNSVRKIIKYHAEPTTVVYGAKMGDLERGAKKLWSNLPADARIENLQLQSDLNATYAYMDRLEQRICDLSNTPKVAFDSEKLAISNTSGLAMQMRFQPLVEKTRKRQNNYKKGFREINKLILLGHQLLGYNIESLVDAPEQIYETETSFTSPLPRDEQAELDAAVKKRELGIWSQAEAIRRLSDVSDYRRLVLELAADKRAELLEAFETQRANSGQIPNTTVGFLSSAALSEDFEELITQMQSTEQSAITKNAPAAPPAPQVPSAPVKPA